MKGLLRKDFYLLASYCKSFLLISAVFIGLFVVEPSNFFFLLMLCIMLGMLPTTLLSYDERERWNVYSQVFPVTRGQYVSVKYLIGLLCSVLVALVVAAICLIRFEAGALLPLLCISLACSLIPAALLLPLRFRFGTEKARYLYLAFIALAAFAGAFLITGGEGAAAASALGPAAITWMVPLLGAGGAALYGLSWLLSIWIYQRRTR